MSNRTFALTSAVALAAAVAFATPDPLLARGDDAEEMAQDRAEVRQKYEDKEDGKGGFTFYDLAYWVDVAKLDDSRWAKEELQNAEHDKGVQLRAKWENAASAAAGMSIRVIVQKLKYHEQKGSSRTPYTFPFENIGESVRTNDWEALLQGFYADWRKSATDLIEDQCQEPKKFRGVAKMYAYATGTDPGSQTRERREWYVWPDSKQIATYVVTVIYGEAMVSAGNDELLEKGQDFVKNFKELKDKKVKWE